jgi:hypothetical protein
VGTFSACHGPCKYGLYRRTRKRQRRRARQRQRQRQRQRRRKYRLRCKRDKQHHQQQHVTPPSWPTITTGSIAAAAVSAASVCGLWVSKKLRVGWRKALLVAQGVHPNPGPAKQGEET